jgi:His-Xaa-Ser system radical SAM maturase HxsB
MIPESKHKKRYVLNFYRIERFGDKILLVTEQGGWVFLSKKRYDELIRHELDDDILAELEKKGIILTEYNMESVARMELERRHFILSPPALHIVLPTLVCNHRCVYCHSSARGAQTDKYSLTTETSRKIVDFIMSCPSKKLKIEFQGGDALLNFDVLKDVVLYSKKLAKEQDKTVYFSVVTNATLLTKEHILWLKEHEVHITTSLDGPKQVHDKNRKYLGGEGTYDDVIKKIGLCKDHGVDIGALMVTTKHSLPYAKEIVDTYIGLGFHDIQLKFMNRMGFAEKQWDEIGYTPEEYLCFQNEALEYILKKNVEGTKIIERITQLILQKVLRGMDPGFLDFRNPCGIAVGQIAYNYNGDIYSCDEGRGFEIFNLGNVWNTDFQQYINSPKTQKLIEAGMLETSYCDTCVFKPYCGPCPVLNYAEQQNIIPKIATNSRCKIMKGHIRWVFDKILNDEAARNVFTSWLEK